MCIRDRELKEKGVPYEEIAILYRNKYIIHKLEKLMKKTGKKINLDVKIDKSIIGGGIIKIGDQVTDGSIRKELNFLRKK